MRYVVSGYLTISVCAEIEADSAEEARRKAEDLADPPLCHQCSNAGSGEDDCWTLNGFDPPPDDAVQDVELAR